MKHSELMMFGSPKVTLRLVHICMHVSTQGTTLVLEARTAHVWSQSCQTESQKTAMFPGEENEWVQAETACDELLAFTF